MLHVELWVKEGSDHVCDLSLYLQVQPVSGIAKFQSEWNGMNTKSGVEAGKG